MENEEEEEWSEDSALKENILIDLNPKKKNRTNLPQKPIKVILQLGLLSNHILLNKLADDPKILKLMRKCSYTMEEFCNKFKVDNSIPLKNISSLLYSKNKMTGSEEAFIVLQLAILRSQNKEALLLSSLSGKNRFLGYDIFENGKLRYLPCVDNRQNVIIGSFGGWDGVFDLTILYKQSGNISSSLEPSVAKIINKKKQSLPNIPFISSLERQINDKMNKVKDFMPSTLIGFRRSEKFVLKRLLKANEILLDEDRREPQPISFFNGEPVYERRFVKQLHSKSHFMKEGLSIASDQKPLSFSKRKLKNMENVGLYADFQTVSYDPGDCEGGIPINSYGNIEIFTSHMIPRGCVILEDKIMGYDTFNMMKDYKGEFVRVVTGFSNAKGYPLYGGVCVREKDLSDITDYIEKIVAQKLWSEMIEREKNCVRNWERLVKSAKMHSYVKRVFKNE
jgi:hypothetical protein